VVEAERGEGQPDHAARRRPRRRVRPNTATRWRTTRSSCGKELESLERLVETVGRIALHAGEGQGSMRLTNKLVPSEGERGPHEKKGRGESRGPSHGDAVQ